MGRPATSIRLSERQRAFLDALARYLNPEMPSRSTAIEWMSRNMKPPEELDPRAAAVRRAHKELMK